MSLNSTVKLFTVNSIRNFQSGFGSSKSTRHGLHLTTLKRYPLATALQLPNNIIDINSAETGRFSPLRERDISGPVINFHDYKSTEYPKIDFTVRAADPHLNSYDCRGAVSLSSSMQSNVPSPFSGDQSHLGMPGSQWGQGYKYLSEHLHCSHYLTLRNKIRGIHTYNVVLASPVRRMSSETKHNPSNVSIKEKFKRAVTEYGSTVIIFHVSISLMSLGTCYLLVSSGLDVASMVTYLNLGDGILSKTTASNAGTFVVAYAFHKVFAPARMAITLAATPFIVRHLRKIGVLKQPSSKM